MMQSKEKTNNDMHGFSKRIFTFCTKPKRFTEFRNIEANESEKKLEFVTFLNVLSASAPMTLNWIFLSKQTHKNVVFSTES